MDAAAGGDAPPVEPEVVRTPTRAIALTHRVLLLFDDSAGGANGWSNTTPRATAEPQLNAWAEQLGPAATSSSARRRRDPTTLDDAGIWPPSTSSWMQRVRPSFPDPRRR